MPPHAGGALATSLTWRAARASRRVARSPFPLGPVADHSGPARASLDRRSRDLSHRRSVCPTMQSIAHSCRRRGERISRAIVTASGRRSPGVATLDRSHSARDQLHPPPLAVLRRQAPIAWTPGLPGYIVRPLVRSRSHEWGAWLVLLGSGRSGVPWEKAFATLSAHGACDRAAARLK